MYCTSFLRDAELKVKSPCVSFLRETEAELEVSDIPGTPVRDFSRARSGSPPPQSEAFQNHAPAAGETASADHLDPFCFLHQQITAWSVASPCLARQLSLFLHYLAT